MGQAWVKACFGANPARQRSVPGRVFAAVVGRGLCGGACIPAARRFVFFAGIDDAPGVGFSAVTGGPGPGCTAVPVTFWDRVAVWTAGGREADRDAAWDRHFAEIPFHTVVYVVSAAPESAYGGDDDQHPAILADRAEIARLCRSRDLAGADVLVALDTPDRDYLDLDDVCRKLGLSEAALGGFFGDCPEFGGGGHRRLGLFHDLPSLVEHLRDVDAWRPLSFTGLQSKIGVQVIV